MLRDRRDGIQRLLQRTGFSAHHNGDQHVSSLLRPYEPDDFGGPVSVNIPPPPLPPALFSDSRAQSQAHSPRRAKGLPVDRRLLHTPQTASTVSRAHEADPYWTESVEWRSLAEASRPSMAAAQLQQARSQAARSGGAGGSGMRLLNGGGSASRPAWQSTRRK